VEATKQIILDILEKKDWYEPYKWHSNAPWWREICRRKMDVEKALEEKAEYEKMIESRVAELKSFNEGGFIGLLLPSQAKKRVEKEIKDIEKRLGWIENGKNSLSVREAALTEAIEKAFPDESL